MAEAVVRELSEETGLEGVCGKLLGWAEVLPERPDDVHFVVADFLTTVLAHDEPVAGDDAAEAVWVPLDEVTSKRLVDGLAELLYDSGILDTIV